MEATTNEAPEPCAICDDDPKHNALCKSCREAWATEREYLELERKS